MNIVMKIAYGSTAGFQEFGHFLPETSGLFLRIFTDTIPELSTPTFQFELVGDKEACVLTICIVTDSYDAEKYGIIIERFKYYNKYHFAVESAEILVDGKVVYTCETNR